MSAVTGFTLRTSEVRKFRSPQGWRLGWRVLPAFAAATVAAWAGPARAIEVVAVEEHWELTLGEPDAGTSSPQVSMVMSAVSNLDQGYYVFTLNHRSHPEWTAGGLQVQRWVDDEVVAAKTAPQDGMLSHENEKVTWVQRLSLADGSLTFEVVHGTSESWGEFGDDGALQLVSESHLHNLNGYRPGVSIEESGVSFAGNRVKSLILTKLVWYDSEGHSYELNAPIDVDADLDP
jgi:hypothetical protein